jgi:hypothetical protein
MTGTQFVIELAGPAPTPAASAAVLLQPAWFTALGNPKVFVLRPGEADWAPCIPTKVGFLDAIALAWNYLSGQGQLSTRAAIHLQSVADQYAHTIQRQAIPLTAVQNVDSIAQALVEVRDSLDAGLSVMVLPKSGVVAERDLWIACADLGLTFSPKGSFDWVCPGHPAPILSVTPIGATDSFSLGAVQREATHQGAAISFRLATCPTPTVAADGIFRCADFLAQQISGVAVDDDQRLLDQTVRNEIRTNIAAGVDLLNRARVPAGSAEALSLFS